MDVMLLTDALLLDYKRCQRRGFLNFYGDPQQRDPERDFLLKLRQESQNHIAEVLATFYPDYQQPQIDGGNLDEIARQTEALMFQGAPCIYQGVLLQPHYLDRQTLLPNSGIEKLENPISLVSEQKIALMGSPHLLIKQPGRSKFGNWLYLPVSIQLGRRPKPEYKIVATFYAYLLATIQGTLPPTAQMILRRRNSYAVDLFEWLPRLENVLLECLKMLLGQQEPEVFISRQRCSFCHWYSHCYAIAQSQQHLSLVPGVTPSRYESLQAIGLATVESLATACPTHVGEAIGRDVASQLQQQAQSIIENRAIRKSQRSNRIIKTIPIAPIELYFDIEAEPERNLDYLLGILLVDRQKNNQYFYSFLAETPAEEEKIWHQFLNLANDYQHAPIFHFSAYEVETIKRLGQLYQTPRTAIEPLLSRCVDLHQWVVTHATLPVESYSLKSLANWMGFQWRDPGTGGDQCVCWYDRWLKTADRSFLEAILRYNEDDCRATFHLKDWLVEFLLET